MPAAAAGAGGRVAAASSSPSSASSARSLDAGAVDALLSSIPREFRQSQDFNPFSHYDDSVHDLTEHQETVRAAIELIVDVHHKGFNTATAAFTRVLDSFAASQRSVEGLLRDLAESRRLLTSRNEQLTELWSATQTLTAVNTTLERIAYIVTVPQHLQRLTAHGLHLHCVVLINSSLQMLSEDDLREVDGLLELREELINARNTETELCIAALHTVVYSKHTHSAEHRAAAADRDREASAQPGSGGGDSASSASSASLSSSLSFLRASAFSPFFSAALQGAADAVEGVAASASPQSSPRSVSALLAEERSASFLSAPHASSTRLLSLLVAALDELHALPAAKTQLSKRVRAEVTAIIEKEKAACRERMSGLSAAKRRIVPLAHQPLQPSQQQQQTLASASPASPAASQRSSAASALPASPLPPPAASTVCPLPRVSFADRELMSQLLSRLFPALLSVLRLHTEAIQLINARLRAAQEQAAAAAASAAASGKQGRREAAASGRQQHAQQSQSDQSQPERDDPRWNIAAVWDTIAIELQLAVQEMLRSSASHAELKLASASSSSAPSASAAAGLRQGRATAASGAAEQQLSFSFDDSSAPSIARMSRREETRGGRAGGGGALGGRGGMDALLQQDSSSRLRLSPQQRAEQQAIVSPSPYNILLLYRPLLAFSQQVQQLLGSGQQQQRAGNSSRREAAAAQQLLGFLHVFIQSSFLPRLQADVNIAMDRVFADDGAFDAAEEPQTRQRPQLPASASHRPLRLRCVLAVRELLDVLLSDAAALPDSVSDYLALISSVVDRLVTRCSDRYSERCRGVFSAQRLLDPAMQQSMEAEPAFTRIIMRKQEEERTDTAAAAALHDGSGGSNGAASSATVAPPSSPASPAVSPLLASFLSPDFRLRVDQLLSDSRAMAELCLIQDSCEWLADQLHAWRLTVGSSSSSTVASQQQAAAEALSSTADVSRGDGVGAGAADWSGGRERKGKRSKAGKATAKLRASGPSAAAAASTSLSAAAAVSGAGDGPLRQAAALSSSATAGSPRRFRLEEQAAHDEAQNGLSSNSGSALSSSPLSALLRGLLPLCSSLLSLSTRCLLTLRCEFQCALFAFLSLQRESCYALTARPAEPEPFVLSLNAQLSAMDESLSRHCCAAVADYVQSGCFSLLSLLCRRIVCQLRDRRVSAAGVLQLQLNLFAVQQQLVNAMRSSSLPETEAQQFDLAVYFLDLLLCDEEELLSGEHGQLLTADELRGIAAINRQQR